MLGEAPRLREHYLVVLKQQYALRVFCCGASLCILLNFVRVGTEAAKGCAVFPGGGREVLSFVCTHSTVGNICFSIVSANNVWNRVVVCRLGVYELFRSASRNFNASTCSMSSATRTRTCSFMIQSSSSVRRRIDSTSPSDRKHLRSKVWSVLTFSYCFCGPDSTI